MSSAESLKQRVNNGDIILGVSAPINASKSDLENILSKDAYDFIGTDSQHSAFNEERLVEFCGIAAELEVPVQFRIKHTRESYLIGNLLDLGPIGVEVPQTETEETARESVDYFYYPQQGKRSWGGETRVCINQIPGRLEYSSWWNEKSVLWAQIESIKAVNNANLFAINGADILSWGPNDLAFNLEQNLKDPLKSDDDCINNVLTQLKDSNTKLCVRTYSDYDISKYNSMGITLFLDETILVA